MAVKINFKEMIVSTSYQFNELMPDSSVQTGSDMGGEYMTIPTVNNIS